MTSINRLRNRTVTAAYLYAVGYPTFVAVFSLGVPSEPTADVTISDTERTIPFGPRVIIDDLDHLARDSDGALAPQKHLIVAQSDPDAIRIIRTSTPMKVPAHSPEYTINLPLPPHGVALCLAV